MEQYKVLHFVYGGGSGATRIAEELAIGNYNKGIFKPHLVYRGTAKPSERLKESGVKYSEVSSKDYKRKMLSELIEIIEEFKPDILLGHGYKDHIYARIAAVKAKVPVIIQVEHSTDPYIITYYLMSQFLSIFTDRIICVSNAVKEHLSKRFFNKTKMEVIYNGHHLDNYYTDSPINEREAGVIMVGRFSSQKDHETLIRAARIIKDQEIECPIYLVGGGMDKHVNQMKKLVQEVGLTNRVHFLGRRNDVPELLAQYQISVLSTHYEGLSGVVLESMAAGNLVIATDAPGVSELIDNGNTGFLISPNSPEELANKIINVLNNSRSHVKIAKNGQKYALENFNIDNFIDKYENLFLEELKKKGLQL